MSGLKLSKICANVCFKFAQFFKLKWYLRFPAMKNNNNGSDLCDTRMLDIFPAFFTGRRRAAAKKKKLKNLGKSKSTDTEEEEGEDDQDDGELYFAYSCLLCAEQFFLLVDFFYIRIDEFSLKCSNEFILWDISLSRLSLSSKEVSTGFLSSQNLRSLSQPMISPETIITISTMSIKDIYYKLLLWIIKM